MAYSNYANYLLDLESSPKHSQSLSWRGRPLNYQVFKLSSALLRVIARAKYSNLTRTRKLRRPCWLLVEPNYRDESRYTSLLGSAASRRAGFDDGAHAGDDIPVEFGLVKTPWIHTRADALEAFESRPNRPVFEAGFGQELKDIASLEAQDRVVVVCEQGIGDILQFIPF